MRSLMKKLIKHMVRHREPHDSTYAQVIELIESGDCKLERTIATINGDPDWFLCVTRDSNAVCGIPPKRGNKDD